MATTRRKRASRIAGEVREAIEEKAARRWTPAEIHRHLEEKFPTAKVPDLRTVQRIVADFQPTDKSGPWRLAYADAPAGAARDILDVLAAAMYGSGGRVTQLTQRQAEWISRLRAVAPDLPPWATYRLTNMYMVREDQGQGTDDLDVFLAFTPWRSETQAQRYYEMVLERAELAPPVFLDAVVSRDFSVPMRVILGQGRVPSDLNLRQELRELAQAKQKQREAGGSDGDSD